MTPNPRTKLLIFDLDGTLVDSARDVALSVNELLGELGLPPLPLEQIYGYIGEGVRKLLARSLSPSGRRRHPTELDRVQGRYLVIYRRRLLDHTRPYPGVEETLRALGERGLTLAVLTNKPRRESLQILSGLDLAKHFRAVEGGDSFARRKPDPMGVRHLLNGLGAGPAETLFVGDSGVDLQTARNAGIRCCLVRYGIAATEGLEPDFFVHDLRELVPIVGHVR